MRRKQITAQQRKNIVDAFTDVMRVNTKRDASKLKKIRTAISTHNDDEAVAAYFELQRSDYLLAQIIDEFCSMFVQLIVRY